MSWRVQKFCYFVMVGVSLLIASGFALLGFWPVLPFAGAELLALGGAFYLCALTNKQRERVVIDESNVAVTSCGCHPEIEKAKFVRAWTRVWLTRPTTGRWYPSRLILGSHGRRIEIGRFLTEEERRLLAGELKRILSNPPGDRLEHQNL